MRNITALYQHLLRRPIKVASLANIDISVGLKYWLMYQSISTIVAALDEVQNFLDFFAIQVNLI